MLHKQKRIARITYALQGASIEAIVKGDESAGFALKTVAIAMKFFTGDTPLHTHAGEASQIGEVVEILPSMQVRM